MSRTVDEVEQRMNDTLVVVRDDEKRLLGILDSQRVHADRETRSNYVLAVVGALLLGTFAALTVVALEHQQTVLDQKRVMKR